MSTRRWISRGRSLAAASAAALVTLGAAVVAPAQAVEQVAEQQAVAQLAEQTPEQAVVQAAEPSNSEQAEALEELAEKPYMGFSTYSMQVYSGNTQWLSAEQLIAQSDAMHETLQPYGYEYINVDAGWNGANDEHGLPTPNETVFPDGIEAVIDHVHNNGQKFGLYVIPGLSPQTYEDDVQIDNAPGCFTGDIAMQPLQQADYWDLAYRLDFSNPCAQAYIDSIADRLAGWGVDFIKLDSVTPGSGISDLSLDARDDVAAWSSALGEHGIWLELSWALDIQYADYWQEYAQGWRVDWDVECYCAGVALTKWDNIARLFPRAAEWWRHAGPGGWNDFDSLNVGNGSMDGLTKDERRAAATFWAVSAVPMYVGTDMTNLDEYGIELLTNPEVIAVNQAGRPAQPVSTSTNRQTWYALNPDGTITVALFNLGQTDADMTVNFADLGLDGSAKVRDLWAEKNLGTFDGELVAEDVPIHGTRLFTLTPQPDSTLAVNDDDLRVSYDGEWERNDGKEVAATSQPFTVAVDAPAPEDPVETGSTRTYAVNNDDPSITYTGPWNLNGNRGFGDYEDDIQWSEVDGSAFEYTFVGTGIDYVTELHQSQGEVDIYLDGVLVDTVDTYADPAEGRKVLQVPYSVRDLPNGTHTLRAVKKSGQFMLLDKLDVIQESLLEEDRGAFDSANPADIPVRVLRDPRELDSITSGDAVLAEGSDYSVDGDIVTLSSEYLATLPEGDTALDFHFRGDFRDDVHAATEDGSAVEFVFDGSAITVTGPLAPDQSEVEVYLDGKLVERVDTHSDVRLTQQTLFTQDGLKKNREHTLRLVKTSGEVLRFDQVEYTAD